MTKEQRDRPRWKALEGAQSEVVTDGLLPTLIEGDMLRTRAQVPGTADTIPVVFRMVSEKKAAVMTGRGFDARALIGAKVVRLVRVVDEVTA